MMDEVQKPSDSEWIELAQNVVNCEASVKWQLLNK
jgi:hypothetical protein